MGLIWIPSKGHNQIWDLLVNRGRDSCRPVFLTPPPTLFTRFEDFWRIIELNTNTLPFVGPNLSIRLKRFPDGGIVRGWGVLFCNSVDKHHNDRREPIVVTCRWLDEHLEDPVPLTPIPPTLFCLHVSFSFSKHSKTNSKEISDVLSSVQWMRVYLGTNHDRHQLWTDWTFFFPKCSSISNEGQSEIRRTPTEKGKKRTEEGYSGQSTLQIIFR